MASKSSRSAGCLVDSKINPFLAVALLVDDLEFLLDSILSGNFLSLSFNSVDDVLFDELLLMFLLERDMLSDLDVKLPLAVFFFFLLLFSFDFTSLLEQLP